MSGIFSAPVRVAVVGCGPSGLFAAEELCAQGGSSVTIDVLERLPVPFGLVRYGVAPDHPGIKSVAGTLAAVMKRPQVRFIGGVEIGDLITHEDLLRCYDAVVYATGAPSDRRLQIPGEDLPGSVSATDFVSWYNGHPDSERTFPLQASSVAVLGVGNVALDVARILARDHAELASTDMPRKVLAALGKHRVRDVFILGRRGPEHAKFSSKELRELGHLEAVNLVVDPDDLRGANEGILSRAASTNLSIFQEWSQRPRRAYARSITFGFSKRPVQIIGDDKVEGLRVEGTRSHSGGSVEGTGEFSILPVQLVVRAIGYRSMALTGLPFDAERGVVPSQGGRIIDANGAIRHREYVAGWLKRGPTGVIGTNKSDARETVRSLVEDLESVTPLARPTIEVLLGERGVRWVTLDGWSRIDRAERDRGTAEGRSRSKIRSWKTLNNLAMSITPQDQGDLTGSNS